MRFECGMNDLAPPHRQIGGVAMWFSRRTIHSQISTDRCRMLSPKTITAIEQLAESPPPARLSGVGAIDSAEALQLLAYVYNWDDGFDVPTAIANHPKCDLGTALDLFWLAEAICWLSGEIEPGEYNRDWAAFCELVTNRLIEGHYPQGETSCKVPLGIPKRHQLKKQGVPAILITDVLGPIPPPFGETRTPNKA